MAKRPSAADLREVASGKGSSRDRAEAAAFNRRRKKGQRSRRKALSRAVRG